MLVRTSMKTDTLTQKVNIFLLLGHICTNYWPGWGCLRPFHMVQFPVTTCKTYTFSDNLVSLTQLTKIGVIFVFTGCDISCLLTSCYYKSH